MRRILAAFAAVTLSLPIVAAAQDHRDRDGGPRAGGQAPAHQENRGPENHGREGAAPPGRAAQAQPAPQSPAPNVAQGRGRERGNANQQAPAPNVAQEQRGRGRGNAKQQAPEPNVVQEQRGRAGRLLNVPGIGSREANPQTNFAQNRDRDREAGDRDRGQDRGRDFGANRDRGRDFRGDRDRSGRFFNFRGRQYAAVRAPSYSYPRGWGYRHWDRGEFLPRVFLEAPFYFDYDWLGLPPPPAGARWVRNGPDALLVSTYDGRILDVIYDAFY